MGRVRLPVVSPYLVAIVIAAVALLALVVLVVWAVALVRRFGVLVAAYRRQLAAESALLEHRGAALAAELARRRGRTPSVAPAEGVDHPH